MTEHDNKKVKKLRALQEIFIKELPVRLESIRQVWNSGDIADKAEFVRMIHSLSGSAGTFGFPQLGLAARDMELLINQQDDAALSTTSHEWNSMIEQDLLKLQKIAEKGPENVMPLKDETLPIAASHHNAEEILIYVLEDEVHLAKEIQQQLHHFGYSVEFFQTTQQLKAGLTRKIPDALLADIHLPEGEGAGPRAIANLSKDVAKDIPVIFASGHNTWQDRLSAVRAGGQAYLLKPINFSLLVEQLDRVTGRKQESNYRILIVDDTRLLAEHYAAVLDEVGMQAKVLNNAENILDVLAEFRPDLILMDIYMPGCTGIEAAQVIRQHSAYTNLPIVYLSTEKSLDHQLQALYVGGDDFLQKPISDSHLVTAVRIRARRFRELSALMNRDSLTGLLNHINLKLALEREISQAQRRNDILSFVMLDLDHFKSVNDTYGHPVGDQVIKSLARLLNQRLRKGDIAARYGGEEFAVILPDTPAEDAFQLIEDLREQFSHISFSQPGGDFNVTLSAGIAVCDASTDLESLVIAADSALYKAKNGGRNQIIIATNSVNEKEGN